MKYYFIVALVMLSPNAFAYIDPGTITALGQGLLALLGICIVFIRKPIEFLRKFFKKK
jgi:hypothetical protein